MAIKRAPDARTTAANSTYFVFLDIAIGLCPFLLGWSIPLIGYRGLYLSMVAVIAVSFALYLMFRKRKML